MESMTPGEARDALSQAAAARLRMADGLRLPSYFHVSLGAAIAVQVGTTAWGVSGHSGLLVAAVLVVGIVAFIATAAVQLARFRRLNGAWVGGLASQVVLGMSTVASVVYVAGFAAAVWAGLADQWWLLVLASLACGSGYAWVGRRWWDSYRHDPREPGPGRSTVMLVLTTLLAVGGIALVLVGAR